MSLSVNIGRPFLNDKTLDEQARSILSKYGTDAHVYLPGADGVAVSGLLTNNYTDSNGSTGYSSVDGVAGLVLDAMGSVGSELVTNGDFASATGWTVPTGWSVGSGVATASSTSASLLCTQFSPATGRTYVVEFDWTHSGGTLYVAIGLGTAQTVTSSGHKRFLITCGSTASRAVEFYGGSVSGTIDNISVREVTGIHATQSTTAAKPAVRRGLYNELLNSATPATQSVTCIAAPYTLALYGTGSVTLSGTGSGTLNGTGASDLVVLNFTPTAGSVTFTKSGTVSSFGLFKGTLTAAQILAEGGIPITTSTAASGTGNGWWWLDGGDSLALGSVPFQVTDDHCVVAGATVNTVAAGSKVIASNYGTGARRVAQLSVETATLTATWTDDAATAGTSPTGTVVTVGTAFIATARKVGNAKELRKNGVSVNTSSTAVGTTTLTTAAIGTDGSGYQNGATGPIIFIKGTVSDSDLLTLERWVASLTPAAPSF